MGARGGDLLTGQLFARFSSVIASVLSRMQNDCAGDIGDFGKYALLHALAGDELRLGVNWNLNADKENSGDGKFTDYPHLRACDPVWHDALKAIVQSDRSVAAVERSGILPRKTVFFSLPVSKPRAAWNDRALNILFGADLVFMDPDTGFGPAEPAYVVPEEVSPYLHRGQSLIIYQHHFHHERVDATIRWNIRPAPAKVGPHLLHRPCTRARRDAASAIAIVSQYPLGA